MCGPAMSVDLTCDRDFYGNVLDLDIGLQRTASWGWTDMLAFLDFIAAGAFDQPERTHKGEWQTWPHSDQILHMLIGELSRACACPGWAVNPSSGPRRC